MQRRTIIDADAPADDVPYTGAGAAARSRILVPLREEWTAMTLLNAQARFFPAWWMYIGATDTAAPRYRVRCETEEELALAKRVEPEIVDAQYVLVGSGASKKGTSKA